MYKPGTAKYKYKEWECAEIQAFIHDSQIVILRNFVVVLSIGIKGVACKAWEKFP